ncbi:MAG: prolyl oligopeptidase family serine peptidase [Sphingomonadaceae bacterium]
MISKNKRMPRLAALALGISASVLAVQGAAAAHANEAASTAASGEMQIPPAEFVKKANMRQPRISPDGRHLAYFAAADGKEVLVVMDLTNPAKPPVPIVAAEEAREGGDRTVTGFRWIGSGHVVMTIIQREQSTGPRPVDYRRLIAYSLDSGKIVQQAWDKAGADASNILWIDQKSGDYLLERDAVGENTERYLMPEVVRVNVATGQYKMVQRTNPMINAGWTADADGVVRAGFSNDSDNGKLRILYRSNDKENFRTVYNAADSSFTKSIPAPRLFIPGTDKAYVISNKDGVDKVYVMDMNTLTLSAPTFETPGFDVQGIVTDYDDRKLIGYSTFDGTMDATYTDPRHKEIKGFLDELFGKGEARLVDSDQAEDKLIIYSGGTNKGGGFYLYDVPSAKISLLNWQKSAIRDTQINPVKAEWITASDGTRIQVIVTYPRHRKGKNLPVVIMPHGGPFGALSATNSLEPWNQPLAEAGYVVIQPNYRGSGGYGKDFVKLGRDPGGYGKRMQDDLTDVLNAYAAKGIVDPKRACIMGWSYGGYASARGAQRDPELWRCAISGAGVYDMPLMNKWDTINLGRFSSGFQATSDNPEEISPARHPEGKWAPILIVAGERDARIPMEQSKTLVGNLRRAGKVENKDFRYIVQPKGTHNLPYDDVHIQWIEESLAWLDRFNPAYVAADSDKAPPKAKAD